MNAIIYDWATRSDFLLRRLYPDALVVKASPLDDAERIISEIKHTRGIMPDPEAVNPWFFHINLSDIKRWLPDRQELIKKLKPLGYRAVNDCVLDVRKSTIQELNRETGLPDVNIEKTDGPDTRVIIKTDYNYGGATEAKLSPVELEKLGLLAVEGCPVSAFDEYYLNTLGDVSEEILLDERLVVEKYIDNPDNKLYRFYRCGSRVVVSEIINENPIKKMVPGLPRQNWYFTCDNKQVDLHPRSPVAVKSNVLHVITGNAARICERLGLEFGAMDIVVDQGDCPYIIDINPTPGWGLEEQNDMLEFLRGGFNGVLFRDTGDSYLND